MQNDFGYIPNDFGIFEHLYFWNRLLNSTTCDHQQVNPSYTYQNHPSHHDVFRLLNGCFLSVWDCHSLSCNNSFVIHYPFKVDPPPTGSQISFILLVQSHFSFWMSRAYSMSTINWQLMPQGTLIYFYIPYLVVIALFFKKT